MELDFFPLRNRKDFSLVFFLSLSWLATAVSSPAQSLRTLANFNFTNGASPKASLIQGTDGNFYGTTSSGGPGNTVGTVFKITSGGTLTTLHNFADNATDGGAPVAGLVQGTDGNFYGTTSLSGANNGGTVFKITSGGTLTTLYSFCAQTNCTDGQQPAAALVQGTDGNFYGTTSLGGANNRGTVFKITSGGILTTLRSFCVQTKCTDGDDPVAGLVQGTDGNFYGTTSKGGANNLGTVFKITSGGTLTTLYSFCAQTNCTDGFDPVAGLVQGTDGNFYGTTLSGGANNGGTVFKITSGGILTTLRSFCVQTNCSDGNQPAAALVQRTDGNFYGTTSGGGANTSGTVFKITPGGTLTILHSFCPPTNCFDGDDPVAGLVQGTDGNFYGTTSSGGAGNSDGTVFSLDVRVAGDFDGDGKADLAVWRPSNGTWYIIPSSAPTTFTATQWGVNGDVPVRGDYDGDGKTDKAVWRPSNGTWYIIPTSAPTTFTATQWGVSGDIPVPGDYDGDGKTDIAVWRPSTGTWYILPSSKPGTFIAVQWGVSGDMPVPGDYDGDGKTDQAVWRPSTGTWYIIPSSAPTTFTATQWGVSGDTPAPGDYDGDGKTDKAVWRPSTGTWYVIPSSAPTTFTATQWGVSGDMPVPANYDGDGKTDMAVWRPSTGTWYIIPSSAPTTFTSTQWGISTDEPVQKPIGR